MWNGSLLAVFWAIRRAFRQSQPWGFYAYVFTIAIPADAVTAGWAPAPADAVTALFCAWMWHRRRRDRKRVLDLIGAKSHVLVADLVKRAREAGRPRPGYRPAPQGASA
jgi:hypothetical protein